MKRVILIIGVSLLMVSGASALPLLQIKPDTLKFGYVSRGGRNTRPLVLKNVGDQLLVIDSVRAGSSFTLPPLGGMSIPPGESVTISATFAPSDTGNFSSPWIFFNNGTTPATSLNVAARGVKAYRGGEAMWVYQHIEDVVCVAATEDYDNDGFPDVVAEGFDAGAVGNNLVCFSGSGSGVPNIIWAVQPQGGPSNSGGWGDGCLAYGQDHNGDGHGDILLGTAWGGRTVFCIDGTNGQTIWSYDTYVYTPSGWVYSVVETNDLNGDGIPEVLAGLGSDADAAVCLDGATGRAIWRQQVEDAVMSVASLKDINGDGKDEAFFGVADNGYRVYCISGASQGNGTALWNMSIGTSTFWATTIKDINNDGYDDALAGTWSYGNVVYAFSGRRFGTGQIIWRDSVGAYIMRVVSCPDLNHDGYDDVLVASWQDYALVLSGVDRRELWRGYTGGDVWAIDYTRDVTGDNVPEVIYGSFDGNVYLANGATGAELWQCSTGYKIFSVRGIDDVNGDGFADVIAGTQFLRTAGGKVYLISGATSQTAVDSDNFALPQRITLGNYPNPFNSSTVISFDLLEPASFVLSIYDVTGRQVRQFRGQGKAGSNRVTWNAAADRLASGPYFYRLMAGEYTACGRATYLK